MKFKIGDEVKVKDESVYIVSDVAIYQYKITNPVTGMGVGWYKEDKLVSATDPCKVTEIKMNNIEDIKKAEYERGLNEAWEAARRISIMTIQEQYRVFNECGDTDIFGCNSASEAIAKLEAIGDNQDEIKVGDEVKIDGDKGIVIALHPKPYVLSEDGTGFLWLSDNDGLADNKTGRHFDAIEEVLKQMQEEI